MIMLVCLLMLNVFELLAIINYMSVLYAIILVVIGFVIGKIIRKSLFRVLTRFAPKEIADTVSKTIYYVIIFIFVVSAIGTMGIDLTGLVLAGGIIGIILGFALQSITANLVSGIFLFWERPLKPGDFVEIENVLGRVVEINFMSTKILDWRGVLIRVPNEKVFQSMIRNYSSTVARVLELVVGIAYRADVEKAYRVIRKVVDEHPLVLVEPPPDIFVYELGSSSVNIKIRVWVPSKTYYTVLKELLWRIKEALVREGIEIPFPQNDVWFRSPLEVIVRYEKEKGV